MEERPQNKHEIIRYWDSDDHEDIRSVSSSQTTKSGKSRVTSKTLREKLLEQNSHSTEAKYLVVIGCGKGLDIYAAQKNAKSAIENIEAIYVVLPSSSGKEKLSELQTGQSPMDSVTNIIIQGGEALVAVVKSNVSKCFPRMCNKCQIYRHTASQFHQQPLESKGGGAGSA